MMNIKKLDFPDSNPLITQFEAVQRNREQTNATMPKGKLSNIHSGATKTQQTNKPETPKSGALLTAQKALGVGLMGIGFTAAAISLPLLFLGGAVGLGIGEAMKHFKLTKHDDPGKTGLLIGAGVANPVVGALVAAGAFLIKDANTKKSNLKDANNQAPKSKNDTTQNEVKSNANSIGANVESLKQAETVKNHLNITRTAMDDTVEDASDADFTVKETDPIRQTSGSKYNDFFESFNKEVGAKVKLKKIDAEIKSKEEAYGKKLETRRKLSEESQKSHVLDRDKKIAKINLEKKATELDKLDKELNELDNQRKLAFAELESLKMDTDQAYADAINGK